MNKAKIIKESALAGMLIAIGALFSIAAKQYGNVVQGLCFSVGLFGVLCCGARLFTGQVLAVQTIWRKQTTTSDVLVLWVTVWAMNMVGAYVVAVLGYMVGFDGFEVARAKAAMPWNELLARAILCNVMVCLAVWTYGRSDRTPTDALVSCVLPVACFVACGFEHSVADMLYMPLGFLRNAVSFVDCIYVIGVATVGNVIGGAAFAWLVWEGR